MYLIDVALHNNQHLNTVNISFPNKQRCENTD